MNAPALPAINELLSLTLQSGSQLAFDWHIPSDRIIFTSGIPANFAHVPVHHVNNSALFFELVHEDDKPLLQNELRRALSNSFETESALQYLQLRMADQRIGWRWVELSGAVVERDDGNRAVRAVGMFADISARKRAEQHAARLLDLYSALRGTNRAILYMQDPQRLFDEICRISVEHGKFHLVTIRILDPDTQMLNVVASCGANRTMIESVEASADPAKPIGHGPSGAAIRENRPSICNDFLASPYPLVWKTIATELNLQAFASFPFSRGGRPVGVLVLYSTEKNFFDDSLVDLLTEMTQEISYALDNFDQQKRRRMMETALAESEARYRQIIELSPDAICIHRKNKFVLVNEACVRLLGAHDADELLGKDVLPFVHPDYHEVVKNRVMQLPMGASRQAHFNDEIWLRKDGTPFHADIAASKFHYLGSPAVQNVMRDISARKRTEQLQRAQNHVLGMVASGAQLSDIFTAICTIIESDSKRASCAIQVLDPLSGTLQRAVAPSLPAGFVAAIADVEVAPENGTFGAAAAAGMPAFSTDIASDPSWRAWREEAAAHQMHAATAWPIIGKNDKVLGVLALYYRHADMAGTHDLQLIAMATNLAGIAIENKQSEDRIRQLAHYDEMTSLPNRTLFNQLLNHALKSAQRRKQKLAVLFVDLDRFKNINDTLGHDAGDVALREFSRRVRGCIRSSDTLARMGGDEFYLLIEELSEADYAAAVAKKMLQEASQPFFIDGQECHLTASIGIAIYPDDGTDAQSLLKNADIAMYRAKADGKNAFHYYAANKNTHSIERLAMESQLRRAIDNREFVLHYQPKVELASDRIIGVEALVRWQHPERGLLAPGHFISLAEETRLIIPLGMQILQAACRDAKIINAASAHPLRMAVNLSARQLDDEGFLDDMAGLLAETRLPPELLQLEITESMVMHNPDRATDVMNQLRAMGVQFDIDDFGTGYSSLAYLKRFPVHSLKIDQSFIKDIPDGPNDTAITKAIIAMGHSMGMRVIAEGVETARQMAALRNFGCDEIQGFHFSRPIPLPELLDLLARHHLSLHP
jgi:diguanylate cyclase (GGDEF)-like protein/PAS domain S-box-containing protein